MFRIIVSLCFVIAAIIICVWVLRLVVFPSSSAPEHMPALMKKISGRLHKFGLPVKKIFLKEILVLDQKHKIILVHYEQEGYLILLGGQGETVLKGPFALPLTAGDVVSDPHNAPPHTSNPDTSDVNTRTFSLSPFLPV